MLIAAHFDPIRECIALTLLRVKKQIDPQQSPQQSDGSRMTKLKQYETTSGIHAIYKWVQIVFAVTKKTAFLEKLAVSP